jgi:hypothetical protein
MNSWVDHSKVMVVSLLGVTVTLTQINIVIQLGIGLASLAYALIKVMHAYRDYKRKKDEN